MSLPRVTPRVGCVIPCHNHRQWVGDAVRSVVGQDYPREQLRVIVVDAASEDGSFHYLRQLTNTDQGSDNNHFTGELDGVVVEGVRLPEASGPSVGRNTGIKTLWEWAEIFAFLDSDDQYLPQKINQSVEVLTRGWGPVGGVYSDYLTLHEDGTTYHQFKEPYGRFRLLEECLANCDSLVPKYALNKIRSPEGWWFNPTLRVTEDFDLWLRLSESFILWHLAEPLVVIRVGEHSSSSSVSQEVWRDCWQRSCGEARRRAGLC